MKTHIKCRRQWLWFTGLWLAGLGAALLLASVAKWLL